MIYIFKRMMSIKIGFSTAGRIAFNSCNYILYYTIRRVHVLYVAFNFNIIYVFFLFRFFSFSNSSLLLLLNYHASCDLQSYAPSFITRSVRFY